jgi:hypothetical protein
MAVNNNGIVDFWRFLLDTMHDKDVTNAQQGIGMMGMLGTVIAGAPDIQIQMQKIITISDELPILSQANGDLIIPGDLRITAGDTVGLIPFKSARLRFWVMGVTRDPTLQPINETRLGYNGDRNVSDPTAKFAGIKVNVPDGDDGSTSTVTIQGQTINITSYGGAAVTIDGINFKTHAHTDPQGGNSGPPH